MREYEVVMHFDRPMTSEFKVSASASTVQGAVEAAILKVRLQYGIEDEVHPTTLTIKESAAF